MSSTASRYTSILQMSTPDSGGCRLLAVRRSCADRRNSATASVQQGVRGGCDGYQRRAAGESRGVMFKLLRSGRRQSAPRIYAPGLLTETVKGLTSMPGSCSGIYDTEQPESKLNQIWIYCGYHRSHSDSQDQRAGQPIYRGDSMRLV